MEYQLKNDSVEAWQIGSTPVPDWVVELVANKTITDVGGRYSVSCINDRVNAAIGDYITYQPTVWGEPTEEAPQGEVLALQEVKVLSKLDFESVYDVPTDFEAVDEDEGVPSDGIGEDAPHERAYR